MRRDETPMAAPARELPKALGLCLIVCFALFLGGFAALHLLLPDAEFSESQNRYLEPFPELSAESFFDGDFGEQVNVYLSDQFPFLDAWVGLQSSIVRMAGISQNNGVYFAADNYLIEQFHGYDARTLRRALSAIEEFAEAVDIPVSVCVVPNAVWTLADKLPRLAPDIDQRELFAHIREELPGDIRLIDCFDALAAHSGEYIYYRTDHHYTSLGAYYVYAALMAQLGAEALPASAPKVVTDSFEGTMQAKSGAWRCLPDDITLLTEQPSALVTRLGEEGIHEGLYFPEALETKDKYNVFLGGNSGIITTQTGSDSDKTLLMVKDSYAHSLAPFLAAHYGEIHLLDPRYYKLSVLDYMEEHNFDEVLIFYNMSNFANDANIARLAL